MEKGVFVCFCRHGYPQYVSGKTIITPEAAIRCYVTGKHLAKNGKTLIYTSETLRALITSDYYGKALGCTAIQDVFLTDGSLWLKQSPLEMERALDEYYQKIIQIAKKENINQIVLITHQPQLDTMLKGISMAPSTCYVLYSKDWIEMEEKLLTRFLNGKKLCLTEEENNAITNISEQYSELPNPDEIEK